MKLKVLFVCAAGRNRSHALALNSKDMFGFDAIAAGWVANPSVFEVLAPWADRIVLVEGWDPTFIPAQHRDKISILEMGEDRWGEVGHPEMHKLSRTLLRMWESQEFKARLVVYNTLPDAAKEAKA